MGESSERNIKIELNLVLEAKDGKVNSRISFKQMDGVSLETMQLIGRKVQWLKKSLDGVFAGEENGEKMTDDETAAEETPSEREA